MKESTNIADDSEVSSLRHSLQACWLDNFTGENNKHQQIEDHFQNMSSLISQ